MEHQGIEAQLSTAPKTQKQNQTEIKISPQVSPVRWIAQTTLRDPGPVQGSDTGRRIETKTTERPNTFNLGSFGRVH